MRPDRQITTLTEKPVLTDSITAREDLSTMSRFVGFDGGYCAPGQKAKGVLTVATRQGEQASVGVVGLQIVEAGGPVMPGDEVESGLGGVAVPRTEGRVNGIAHTGADMPGEKILVLVR